MQSPSVYFYFLSLQSVSCHCFHYNLEVEQGLWSLSLTLESSYISLAAKRSVCTGTQIQTVTVSFLVPFEFMCDCSTIWSRPIYSRLQLPPPPPPPPCSLKVTPGDFGRGVLELLCQCEALQWQVCWWGWSLWSRTAPFPALTHQGCILPSTDTDCKYIPPVIQLSASTHTHTHTHMQR